MLDSLLAISTLWEHPQYLESFRKNPFLSSNKEWSRKIAALQIVHPNVPPPPDEFHSMALNLYNRAIRRFKQRVEDGKATPLLALLSCALFFCIELIRDNVYMALSLFTRGTGLLKEYAPIIAEEKNQGLLTLIKLMFSRIGVVAATFGVPRWLESPSASITDNAFTNLADARTAMFALMADSQDFVKDANTWKESLILNSGLDDVSSHKVVSRTTSDTIETMYDVKFGYVVGVSLAH